MLTLHKTGNKTIDCVSTADNSIEQLLNKEWLLTNSRGGYSSSTVVGCNTRRYHGLLTGSLTPPVNRIVGLSNCLEMVISNGRATELATFEFDGKFAPAGFGYIKKFRRNEGVHFDYQLDQVNITKSVYLLRDSDTIALVYDFTKVNEPVEFTVRPFVALRDFHSLQKSYAEFCSQPDANSVLVRHNVPESCELFLYSRDVYRFSLNLRTIRIMTGLCVNDTLSNLDLRVLSKSRPDTFLQIEGLCRQGLCH